MKPNPELLRLLLVVLYPIFSRPKNKITPLRLGDVLKARKLSPEDPVWEPYLDWKITNERPTDKTPEGLLKLKHGVDTLYVYRHPMNREGHEFLGLRIEDGVATWIGELAECSA